ncbi:T9SS type B sorting domain-containing protein [Rufibacter immobilis]|uniref:T9SS type B sorting domain-containing protein n=1 Tax=Rufibacter immobilis TaxID=1348778 RepID=UPI0035F0E2D7
MPLVLQKVRALLFVLCGLILSIVFFSKEAQATHLRAGNIYAVADTTANPVPGRFFFTLITFSVFPKPFEDVEATLYFGDCTSQKSPRESETLLNNGQNNTLVNVYRFEHIYGPGTYTATFVGENRNGGIVNISSSVTQTFFLQTTVTVDPLLLRNRSPRMQYPPVDVAVRGQVFVHNPAAFDPDGDSLAFKLLEPRIFDRFDACGNPLGKVAPGYQGLENYLSGQPISGRPAGLTLDVRSGQLTWNNPGRLGEFNIAFVVEEWRGGRLIGRVIRDMQIFVREDPNRPPVITVPRDTCVVAGTLLRDTITVTDPDRHPVIFTALGSMLPPNSNRASFVLRNDTTGIFSWQTTCQDVRLEPYQVVFRAEDQPPTGIKLVDLQPWRITVVGPPPVLLTAVPQSSSSIRLNWENYTCPNATRMYIYRKIGPSDFVPEACETGIPASAGYVLVGQVSAGVTTFLDNNNGRGLERNRTYCYRIYAEFPQPGGGKSIASNELCATLESISITKVSVTETNAATGKIRVEWSKPRTAVLAEYTAPFLYRLLRAEGQNRGAGANFVPVTGYNFRSLNDTVFTDNNLNTQDTSFTYRVEFYHSGTTGSPTVLVDSSSASSVRLNGRANGPTMELNWTYNVPWNNASTTADPRYHIIWVDSTEGRNFVKLDSVLATATSGTFSRRIPLTAGKQYCVYVQTEGTFDNPFLPDPILNNSQELCLTRLCVPVLEIDRLPCDDTFVPNPPFFNRLRWSIPPGCDPSAIDFYTLYYRETDDGAFVKIGTVDNTGLATYEFIHQGLASYAGCYLVTATDFAGMEGEQSNIVCNENCIVFSLPNIITPNSDGKNDVFTPKQGATFIKRATLRVFNRWGNKVYESSNEPGLNWAGVDNNGKALSEATYFYQVEVEFYGRTPDIRTFKGWVEIVR